MKEKFYWFIGGIVAAIAFIMSILRRSDGQVAEVYKQDAKDEADLEELRRQEVESVENIKRLAKAERDLEVSKEWHKWLE